MQVMFMVAVAALTSSFYLADAACTAATCANTPASTCSLASFGSQPYPLTTSQKNVMEQCIVSGSTCVCDSCASYVEQNTCSADSSCFWTPRGGCVMTDKMCIRFSANATECDNFKMCKHDGSLCLFTTPAAPTATLTDCPPMHPFAVAMIILIFMTVVGMVVIIGVMIVLRKKAREEEERLEEERDAEAALQASKRPATFATAKSVSRMERQEESHYSGYAASPAPAQNAASADDLDVDAGGGDEAAAEAGGYYDEEGNWIATDGSYDPNAYGYDENGNYVGGDGADQGGYYDEEGNWVATDGGDAAVDDEDF